MRSLFPSSLQSLRVGISRRTLTLLRIDRRWRGQSSTMVADVPVAPHAGHGTIAHELLAAELRSALKGTECRRVRAHVVLADELVRYFMVTPPKNAGSLRDCRAAAQMRFQSLYGEPATAWQIEADWDARATFLACAMPAGLLHALQAVLAEQHLALAELTPHFVAAWNRWRAKLDSDSWFGVVHDHGMTVGAIHDGRLQAVRPLDATVDDLGTPRLRDMLAREALLLNLPMPARLQLTGASLGGTATTSADTLSCETLDQAPGQASAAVTDLARAVSAGLALAGKGMPT